MGKNVIIGILAVLSLSFTIYSFQQKAQADRYRMVSEEAASRAIAQEKKAEEQAAKAIEAEARARASFLEAKKVTLELANCKSK